MVWIWTAALIQGFLEVCSKWVLLLLPGKGLSDLKKRAEARAPQMYTDLVTFQFQQSPPSPYTLTFPSVASVWFFIALAKANTFLRGHGNFLLPLKKLYLTVAFWDNWTLEFLTQEFWSDMFLIENVCWFWNAQQYLQLLTQFWNNSRRKPSRLGINHSFQPDFPNC